MKEMSWKIMKIHCVKSVRIRSYSGPYFSCIRTEYGKMRTKIAANTDTFYAVKALDFQIFFSVATLWFVLHFIRYFVFCFVTNRTFSIKFFS